MRELCDKPCCGMLQILQKRDVTDIVRSVLEINLAKDVRTKAYHARIK